MTTFQQRLRDFLGSDQFGKFVSKTQFPRMHRLLWWQERDWNRFVTQFPEYRDFDYLDLVENLRICEKHYVSLQEELVPIRYNVGRCELEEYLDSWVDNPNAKPFVVREHPLFSFKRSLRVEEVLYCPVCREKYWKRSKSRRKLSY